MWVSGALSRSDSATSSASAPRHPAPQNTAIVRALSISATAAAISSGAGATGGRGRSVGMLGTACDSLAAKTSGGMLMWATPRAP